MRAHGEFAAVGETAVGGGIEQTHRGRLAKCPPDPVNRGKICRQGQDYRSWAGATVPWHSLNGLGPTAQVCITIMPEAAKEDVVWPNDAWRLRLLFQAASLSPPAIQYAIFSEEPIVRFLADLARVRCTCRVQLNDIHDINERRARRQIQLAGVWERLFRAVRGDEVHLAVPGCSELVLMSNAPAGKKWFVTKTVEVGARRCCWSVPFEAVAGHEAAVSLREDDALDLTTLDNDPP